MSKVTKAENGVEKTVSQAPKTKKKGNLMYLGPTIAGAIRHSTVFKDGVLPKEAQRCVAEFPIMEHLFVEMGEMPAAVRQLAKRSVMKEIYDQVSRHFAAKN